MINSDLALACRGHLDCLQLTKWELELFESP
jgi:hypothetical protein